METITLNFDDYKELIRGYTLSKSMELDLEFLINGASYDSYDKELGFNGDNLRMLCKKYSNCNYTKNLEKVKKEWEEK